MSPGRLTLLATSPRVAPGLLSAAAWDVLRSGPVYVADATHPQVEPLRAAGVAVTVAPSPPAGDGVVWLLPPGDDGDSLRSPSASVVVGSSDLPG